MSLRLRCASAGADGVHSTSWRHEDGRVILTYIAVIAPPAGLPPDSMVKIPIRALA
jgi:hypothetical protein